jgi:RHS repeat-associated protein
MHAEVNPTGGVKYGPIQWYNSLMRTIVPPDVGSYSYAGTDYANPHAVTSVGGTTYTYDNNGNVTAIGSLDYTWDWRNRLASAERSGSGITTYGYDHSGQRVFQATGSATTSYPDRYYNVASSSLAATTTKHIFSPDGTLLATVVGSGTSTASTTYLHPDHLGGTNVATDENGEAVQTLDYYPYGSQRIATGSFDAQRRFIGEEYDGDTEFSYLNARYYQSSRGQFLSQDPAGRDNPGQFLSDPQQLNGYAYSRNNPIRFLDKTGEVTIEFSRPIPWLPGASHNAIAGYNVPGFPKGVITVAGYSSSDNPFTNKLISIVGPSDSSLGGYKLDYAIAQRILKGDISGTNKRGFTLIKDFGGLTEEEYWRKMIEAGGQINDETGKYNALTVNSHSAINSMKTYANPSSRPYHPTTPVLGLPWLTPASGVNVLPGVGSPSSGSVISSTAFGLSANSEISAGNVGSFISFISQFAR